ncbi:branched-chain amino acid transporter [Aerococcus urinaehominis]|uniref:Branched-chain amino acid transport system carrier protein n=1 Tax=Aerococcus urinaehominis TaxID=128944 RepID=A0A109RH56_9LACT|nr:branched-chain amino acid transport system II carrier protein [Aerococcus urinaehominis]AMB99846.1 branched-chain amino acid transporter [Aerococcus urinaehominis]SDM63559.1 branched-chain amino acid:cation transporter, LIVCS family [Aerococcus urinaehominis]
MKKQSLSRSQRLVTALMLFGLFFGAGNIIFPIFLGQAAANQTLIASLGFNLTAVGLPLLAIAAMGISGSDSVMTLASRVSKPFGYFFTIALYLTIGPFFAIPRLATVSYEVGLTSFVPANQQGLGLFSYSLIFFALALFLALRPSRIIEWVGKYLTPIFLALLLVIVIRAWLDPAGLDTSQMATGNFAGQALTTGLLEGYNTMDSLAGLAFGIIVIKAIQDFGVKEGRLVAVEVVKSGFLAILLMSIIYLALALLGWQSRNYLPLAENGGIALSQITQHYFGQAGQVLLALLMFVACLKTAIGLIVALSETFAGMFPNLISQRAWAIIASLVGFGVANIGLTAIIQLSLPVLMLLYPLAIVLIVVALLPYRWQGPRVYQAATAFTLVPALVDFIRTAPAVLSESGLGTAVQAWATSYLPLYGVGFGWILPALIGILVGLWLNNRQRA